MHTHTHIHFQQVVKSSTDIFDIANLQQKFCVNVYVKYIYKPGLLPNLVKHVSAFTLQFLLVFLMCHFSLHNCIKAERNSDKDASKVLQCSSLIFIDDMFSEFPVPAR